jgi:cell division protein FtsI/penicillin-binding protein 2
MVATGIDSGSFTQWTPVDDTGNVNVGAYTVQNWCADSCNFLTPNEDVRTMLKYSSNVGAVLFSRHIPDTTFYNYMNNFGLDQLTGVDLAGEAPGDMRQPNDAPPKPQWTSAYKDTTAYGQGGISVTPLQLVNAYAVLANGGLLVRPHLLQSYTLNGQTTVMSYPPVRRVITQNTSDQLKQIMVDSGIDGEACLALVPGWDVAAKTGTAYPASQGHYLTYMTTPSTIAFAPADNPRFVVLVVLHLQDQQFASLVAAPVVHNILQELFNYYRVPPALETTQPKKLCPGPLQ